MKKVRTNISTKENIGKGHCNHISNYNETPEEFCERVGNSIQNNNNKEKESGK